MAEYRVVENTSLTDTLVAPVVEPVSAPEVVAPEAAAPPAESPITEPVVAEPAKVDPPPAPPAPPAHEPVKVEAPHEEYDPWEKLGLPKGGGEFAKIYEAFKANDLPNYLKVATADYDKVEDMELLRMDFDKQHPTLDRKDRDALFQHQLETKYNITGDEETDKFAKLEIKSKAEQIRSGLKADQANYKMPAYEPPQPAPQVNDEQTEQKKQEFLTKLGNHPTLKSLEASKILNIGSGEEAYKLAIDFDVRKTVMEGNLLDYLASDDPDIPIDINKYVKFIAFAKDMDAYDMKAINHGRSLEAMKQHKELNNPPEVNTSIPEAKPKYVVVN